MNYILDQNNWFHKQNVNHRNVWSCCHVRLKHREVRIAIFSKGHKSKTKPVESQSDNRGCVRGQMSCQKGKSSSLSGNAIISHDRNKRGWGATASLVLFNCYLAIRASISQKGLKKENKMWARDSQNKFLRNTHACCHVDIHLHIYRVVCKTTKIFIDALQ